MINGIINIYKKKGFTSHDVVAKARGILRQKKIGHTGTLDPEAEGVLPICVGSATKVVPFLTDADKCYEAEVILGTTTTTEDATGDVLEVCEVKVTKDQFEQVLASFVGNYTQTPPMYSAIKVNGTRLYELARQGIVVERPSREVIISSCELIEVIDNTRYRIRVNCSKGTYIRTLCTDIGKALGCGAHMGYLLRTRVGHFNLSESITLQKLEEIVNSPEEAIEDYVESTETLFKDYKRATVNSRGEKYLKNGNALKKEHLAELDYELQDQELLAIYNKENIFTALYYWEQAENLLRVKKMFL